MRPRRFCPILLQNVIGWISDDGVKTRILAGEDFGEFGVPIEGIDLLLEFFGDGFWIEIVVEVWPDQGIAALDVVSEIGQYPFMKKAVLVLVQKLKRKLSDVRRMRLSVTWKPMT